MNHSGDTLIGMLIDLFLKDKEATVQRRKANMGDCDHYGHGRKSEDKIPFAAASAASSMKVPKKKGRKVKPKGMYVDAASHR